MEESKKSAPVKKAPSKVAPKKKGTPRKKGVRKKVVVPPEPRPWVRFWARMIDYSLFFIVVSYLIGVCKVSTAPVQPFFGALMLFLWTFIEAFLLAVWGKTPGKWILRTEVLSNGKKRLSYSEGLSRSLSVWWLGMGAGIPIISLITMTVAGYKLTKNGITSWDQRRKYHVAHKKVQWWRTLIVVLFFLAYAGVIVRVNYFAVQYP